MSLTRYYPNTTIEALPGDIIYSSIARSTYFVGHSVIIGTDFTIKEVIPSIPGWQILTLKQHWNRHHPGDKVTILRSKMGAKEAASWITGNIKSFKTYNLINYDINNLAKSYCYKFVTQAYYHGAGISIVKKMNRLLLPNDIKKSSVLDRVAIIYIN